MLASRVHAEKLRSPGQAYRRLLIGPTQLVDTKARRWKSRGHQWLLLSRMTGIRSSTILGFVAAAATADMVVSNDESRIRAEEHH